MFNTSPQTRKARKPHRCTWCSQTIEAGSTYERWVTFDDSAFTSRMHPECVKACAVDVREYSLDGEYVAYENDRPTRAHTATPAGDTQ